MNATRDSFQVGTGGTVAFTLTEAALSDLEALALARQSTVRHLVAEAIVRYRVDHGEEILRAHADLIALRAWIAEGRL
jgi:hypothetical protein